MDINFRDEKQHLFFYKLGGIFKSRNAQYYVGGSRYFKYNDFNSDLDIFICLNEGQKIGLSKKLLSHGFVSLEKKYYRSDVFEGLQFHHTENNIQITAVKKSAFELNKITHRKIKAEIDLDKTGVVISVLKKQKEYGQNGREIYDFLKRFFRL